MNAPPRLYGQQTCWDSADSAPSALVTRTSRQATSPPGTVTTSSGFDACPMDLGTVPVTLHWASSVLAELSYVQVNLTCVAPSLVALMAGVPGAASRPSAFAAPPDP